MTYLTEAISPVHAVRNLCHLHDDLANVSGFGGKDTGALELEVLSPADLSRWSSRMCC
jgi:hypothetical protein